MADITTNLLAWWKLDDGGGSSAADATGNGHTGTLNNSPSWAAGTIGGALSFNGSNSSVSAPLVFPTTGTVWVSFNPSRAAANGTDEFLCGCGTSNLSTFHIRRYGPGPTLYGGFYTGGEARAGISADGSNWVQNTRQQLLVTFSVAAGVALYLNGVSMATHAAASTTCGGTTFYIGADEGGANGYSGWIDEVRVYDRILSADEIALLTAYTGATSAPGVRTWYFASGGDFPARRTRTK